MITTYIALGSNLSDPVSQVRQAIIAIKSISQSCIKQVSSLYFSRPMGPQDQPDYINAVLALETELPAIALLDALQAIENKAGRVRKDNRWGARILDLDILFYGDEVINTERLTVPHYGLKLREFVLTPLAEIAPDLRHPDGERIIELSQRLDQNDLKVYKD